MFSRGKESIGYEEKEIYYEGWGRQLGRARSPTICHLQARGPGKLLVVFQTKLKEPRTRGANSVSPGPSVKAQRTRRADAKKRRPGVSQQKQREQFALHLPFVLRSPLRGRVEPTCAGDSDSHLYSVCSSNVDLFLKHPHRHTKK